MTTSWRCVLVGSESLLIQCAGLLEETGAGHQIAAVVSRRASIRRWAAERGIRALPDTGALLAAQDIRPFDYLFSITNLAVLPAEVLALPTRGAINFHDGPLPEYAGLNTPVWAILNGERSHGVTWHLMTAHVDRGDILARRIFELSENETALTLNTKCYQAGIESFEELIAGLADGRITPAAQPGPPERVLARTARPEGAASVDWSAPAGETATLIRALDFGTYANPVASARASYAGKLVILAAAAAREETTAVAPGTIVTLDQHRVTVATSHGILDILRFETEDGEALPPPEAAARYGMRAGGRFDLLAPPLRARLGEITSQVAGHEGFWEQRLTRQAPIELPITGQGGVREGRDSTGWELKHPAGLGADTAVALILGYLARLGDRDQFELSFADPRLTDLIKGAEARFAGQVPLHASVDFSRGFEALRATTAEELKELRRRRSYATDLVARVPALRAQAKQGNPRVLPVAVSIVERLEAAVAIPGSVLTVAIAADGRTSRWLVDSGRLSPHDVQGLQEQFTEFAGAAVALPDRPLGLLPLQPAGERSRVLAEWNATAAPWRTDATVHRLIEEQAARTPDATAVIAGTVSLTYRELDSRANQLAHRLARLGVGPDVLVGLAVDRSVEMMVGLLAIQKAGGAYLPLDPAYPRDRLSWMIEDARVPVLLTQSDLRDDLPVHRATVICLDSDWHDIAGESAAPFDGGATPESLAYVIYTSGSTGKPKGVMVEHRNVVNFFAGMDRQIGSDPPGTWLAVTSLSFDISVLELCWTLARGYRVVLAPDLDRSTAGAPRGGHAVRPIDFSLFYFSSDESEGVADKYRLLIEGAKFGDQHGFAAVWTPERHFHAFGGLYPNPSVTSAAIATITERIKIRAGSVVLPLHHPVRVAEEWSLVDNLSKGRVGISFAAGWQPNDFLLRPENFKANKQVMLEGIETVRRLWRGEAMSFPGATGEPVEIRILPRPVQPELPFWLTSAGNPETFAAAGRIGAFVLTHLLGQSVDELVDKLAAYRKAWQEAGHPGQGHVSLMLHAFVGDDPEAVRDKVRQPLIEYLRSSVSLIKQYAWSFPAFKKPPGANTAGGVDLGSLDDEEMNALLEHSFGRYYETSGLFGTPESCLVMVDRLKKIGVDEIACLIDFGVDSVSVLEHLEDLNRLRKLATPRRSPAGEESLGALMIRHGVTHLQCTPSMLRMLLADEGARPGLRGLRRLMIGGEAFPNSQAQEVRSAVGGPVMNMYGPTETTIWSSVHTIVSTDTAVPLGPPLANQEIYILDSRQQPVPVGVPGEIVIGGAGVVRGYLHRPDLTAERFIAHPVKGALGGRVYRTGDLARFRADGTIEFLGRLDHQVKLRGFRIELGEIEAALLSHREVREVVVVAREDSPGDTRLVAYVVPTRHDGAGIATLRDFLRTRLPDYMVPSHFVPLEALPLTPNGKLDRRALPSPEITAAGVSSAAFEPPSGDLEETIATIWREVLSLPKVGTRDNFFDLGGHSLLAVQVHRRLRETLKRELSITDIFRFPTIQNLSTYLSEGADGAAAKEGAARAEGRRTAMQQRRQPRR